MLDKVLAIDASAETCSVALLADSNLFQRTSIEPRVHAQRLLPMIDDLLLEAGIVARDLNGIAVVNGPGSFTGIRIAISVVQGLAYGLTLPVYTLSSLIVMAYQVRDDQLRQSNNLPADARIVCALDARMGELYWQTYELQNADTLFSVGKPEALDVDGFLERLAAISDLYLVGKVFAQGGLVDAAKIDKVRAVYSDVEPNASALLRALTNRPAEQISHDGIIEPLYVRNEVAWKKRERIRKAALIP